TAIELGALDREPLLGRAGIAGDWTDIDLEDVLHDALLEIGGAAGIGRSHMHLAALLQIVEALHAGAVPDEADADILGHAADPGEAPEIDLHLVGIHPRIADLREIEGADHGAVLRRIEVERLQQGERAGARHVDDEGGWIAWNMPADMAREQSRIEIVAATGGEPDQDRQALAAIEILRDGRAAGDQRRDRDQCRKAPHAHSPFPPPWLFSILEQDRCCGPMLWGPCSFG